MTLRPLVVSAAFVCLVACGTSTDDANGGANGSGNGNNNGLFNTGADGGGDGSGNGNGKGNGNCNAPVDMYIMLDQSGSMHEPQDKDSQAGDCNVGQSVDSKWCKSINALSGYFKSPGAKGQAAALQFFSLKGAPKNSCSTGAGYSTPAAPSAGYTELPSPSFDALLNAQNPDGNTPHEAAIRGLTAFTEANRRGGRVTIGILITDGDPNGCNESLDALSNLLAAHHTATKIRTYVIGMQGATFDNLEKIAAGGNAPPHPDTVGGVTDACGNGNGPCRHWNVGNGDPAVFTAALAAIQASADGCKEGGGFVNPVK